MRRVNAGRAMAGAIVVLTPIMASPAWAQMEESGGAMTMQAVPDPYFEDAKAAFDTLPEPTRIAVQDALVWTGDYSSSADGTFGRRTLEAIQAFQHRTRRVPDGILDRQAQGALIGVAARAKTAVGFAPVKDAAAIGLLIGIPQKVLPKRSPNQLGGTRYQSANDKVTLDTRSQTGGPDDLRGLYERNLAIQTTGRRITYRLQRPDFFVIAGETPSGKFYSRYAQSGDAIRGFSIGYDKTLSAELDRLTVAIANSFQPFGASAPQAAPGPMAGGVSPTAPTPQAGPTAAPGGGGNLTGLSVGPRRVLTSAAGIQACANPRINGQPVNVASTSGGLAVLEPSAPRRTVPLRFASGQPEGTGTVAFFASSEGGRAVVTPAEFSGNGRLVAPLQEGAAGAVVLDKSGAIAGMVGSVSVGRRAVAGLVPPASYPFLAAGAVQETAGAQDGSAPATSSTAAVMPALVRIECQDRAAAAAPSGRGAPSQGIRLPAGTRF